jgi:alpha-glucosidase
MNFSASRIYAVLLTNLFFLFTCSLYSQILNGNKSLGSLSTYTFENGVLKATTTAGNFKLVVYSPNILRLQITQDEVFGDFSYALVAKPLSANSLLKEEATRLILSTDSIDVYISKNPVRFKMTNKHGLVINEDDEAFGTSWLGEEVSTYKKLQEGERFIGLGEKTGNLDRRGQAYTNWNTDYFAYPGTANAIYMTTPFYIGVHHQMVYGIFMDNSSKSHFNFGASNNRFSSFTAEEGEMNYYFIYHSSVPKIIESYTFLTGRMQMPPLWSLGLQQSRYSYYPDTEVLSIAKTFREKSIPADVIYLDIHYMDKYKIFSWDKDRFSNPKKMIDGLKALGFHTAVILDPGIKVEKNYKPYDDGISKNMFVKYPDQSNYTAEVWPGWCHFPDFTNPDVRTWWGDQFKEYVDVGIEGFWNDMNEPASWGQSTPDLVEFNFDGKRATHRTARNVYGLNMTRSTFEGTKKLLKGTRPFLLTRSGYSGIQRYSAVWTGDNVASDEHMMLGVRLVNSMGLTGVPVTGMDVGGFTGGGNEKLFARWITIGAFSPFFRIHANANTREQEPWSNGEYVEGIAKDFISLRYKLMPYLYSIFYEASVSGMPVNRSLAMNYPFETMVYNTQYQNQFLFGPSLLVAPGESTKDYYKVFLPGNEWYDLYEDKYYKGNEEFIAEASVDHLPVFVKGGSIIPMQSVVQHLLEKPSDTLDVHVYHGSDMNSFMYYEDDGVSYAYENGEYYKRKIEFNPKIRSITFEKALGSMSTKFKFVKVVFHGFANMPEGKVNGKKIRLSRANINLIGNRSINGVQTLITDFNSNMIKISW